jgi:hypothetical protein
MRRKFRRQMHSSTDSEDLLLPADQAGSMSAVVTPAERLQQMADDPFIRDTETRASLEF